MSWLSLALDEAGLDEDALIEMSVKALLSEFITIGAYFTKERLEAIASEIISELQDNTLTGAEKMAAVLQTCAEEIYAVGEQFVRGTIEFLLALIKKALGIETKNEDSDEDTDDEESTGGSDSEETGSADSDDSAESDSEDEGDEEDDDSGDESEDDAEEESTLTA